jgi:hypothetical protein
VTVSQLITELEKFEGSVEAVVWHQSGDCVPLTSVRYRFDREQVVLECD